MNDKDTKLASALARDNADRYVFSAISAKIAYHVVRMIVGRGWPAVAGPNTRNVVSTGAVRIQGDPIFWVSLKPRQYRAGVPWRHVTW